MKRFDVSKRTPAQRRAQLKKVLLDPINFAKNNSALERETGYSRSHIRRIRAELAEELRDPLQHLHLRADIRESLLDMFDSKNQVKVVRSGTAYNMVRNSKNVHDKVDNVHDKVDIVQDSMVDNVHDSMALDEPPKSSDMSINLPKFAHDFLSNLNVVYENRVQVDGWHFMILPSAGLSRADFWDNNADSLEMMLTDECHQNDDDVSVVYPAIQDAFINEVSEASPAEQVDDIPPPSPSDVSETDVIESDISEDVPSVPFYGDFARIAVDKGDDAVDALERLVKMLNDRANHLEMSPQAVRKMVLENVLDFAKELVK